MKNILKLSFLAGLFLVFSCTDPCEDVVCENGGTCDEGTCLCAEGYEGDNCETESRAKYLGDFLGERTCLDGEVDNLFIGFREGSEILELSLVNPSDNQVLSTLTLDDNIASSEVFVTEIQGDTILSQIVLTITSIDEVVFETRITEQGEEFVDCNAVLLRQ